MNRNLKIFEKQVRIELLKHIRTHSESGIVVTTSDTPNERIWIRFYTLFYMFETEYAIENQTVLQIAGRFMQDLIDDYNKLIRKKGVIPNDTNP